MGESDLQRIELEAVKALIGWKYTFADDVCMHAKQLAAESEQPNLITVAHFRQAAQLALKSLATIIQAEENRNANQRAA